MEQIGFCLCLFIAELQLPRVRMVPRYNTLDHGYTMRLLSEITNPLQNSILTRDTTLSVIEHNITQEL